MLFDAEITLYDQMIKETEEGIARLREENRKLEEAFSVASSFQNKGMKSEKIKDYSSAVSAYEQCVAFGESSPLLRINDYLYSIERLAVLYRKLKHYDDEVRIVKLGLSHRFDKCIYDSHFARLEKRLVKAEFLKEKSMTQIEKMEGGKK